jgi:hypothetical protein
MNTRLACAPRKSVRDWPDKSRREPRTRTRRAGVPAAAISRRVPWYEREASASLVSTLPLIVSYWL